MALHLKNGYIFTQNKNREIYKGDILIKNNKISKVKENIKEGNEKKISCDNCAILPGLINTHTHISMNILRSIADDLALEKFLQITSKIDKNRTNRDIYIGALLGCIEAIKTGTTTFVDLYYNEDYIAEAVKELGIRGFLGWAILDEELTTQEGNPLENAKNFIKKYNTKKLIEPIVGIQGVYGASEDTWIKAQKLAKKENTICHFHLSETKKEVKNHIQKTGKRPVIWLRDIGFLHDNCLAAHSIWINNKEISILEEKDVSISYNPTSNMKLGSGIFPFNKTKGKVNISIGTDSAMSNNNLDMFEEMKIASILQKCNYNNPKLLSAQETLDMATINAASVINMKDKLGSIEEGKLADLIIIDLNKIEATPFTLNRIIQNLIFSQSGSSVRDVIVNGRIIMRDRNIINIDEKKLIAKANKIIKTQKFSDF